VKVNTKVKQRNPTLDVKKTVGKRNCGKTVNYLLPLITKLLKQLK